MPWHLAILGAGSAAAYYLNTVDPNQFPKILVVGQDDPWSGQRGLNPSDANDPVNFVNQTAQMIEHYGDSVPGMSTSLYPRKEWAESNRKILDRVSVTRVRGQILNVSEIKTPSQYAKPLNGAEKCYQIDVRRSSGSTAELLAAKVVVATGAGSHKYPDKRLENLAGNYPDLFMDMDAFARKPALRQPGKKIIVQGPNAAVDSVDTAYYNRCTVYWLTGPPALLATPHQVSARAVAVGNGESRIYALNRKTTDPKEIKVVGKKISVTLDSGQKLEADHYVWGVGQDDKKAVSFLSPSLLARLEPIYDINQRHGQAFESVEGFQLKGTSRTQGFEVVGAVARQVLINADNTLDHTYLQQLEGTIEELQKKLVTWNQDLLTYGYDFLLQPVNTMVADKDLKKFIRCLKFMKEIMAKISPTWINQTQALASLMINWAVAKIYFNQHGKAVKDADLNNALKILTPSTVGSPQLGSIRTTTAAINGFMPTYVASSKADANFSHDDQTILRVYIAKNYPCVPEEDAARIIKRTIEGRKSTKDHWGYTEAEINGFKQELQAINSRWAGTLSTAKVIGTGQTFS